MTSDDILEHLLTLLLFRHLDGLVKQSIVHVPLDSTIAITGREDYARNVNLRWVVHEGAELGEWCGTHEEEVAVLFGPLCTRLLGAVHGKTTAGEHLVGTLFLGLGVVSLIPDDNGARGDCDLLQVAVLDDLDSAIPNPVIQFVICSIIIQTIFPHLFAVCLLGLFKVLIHLITEFTVVLSTEDEDVVNKTETDGLKGHEQKSASLSALHLSIKGSEAIPGILDSQDLLGRVPLVLEEVVF